MLAASAKTKSPKLVQEFLKYVASPEGQKIVSKGVGYPVGTTDASALPETYKPVASIVTSTSLAQGHALRAASRTAATVSGSISEGVPPRS